MVSELQISRLIGNGLYWAEQWGSGVLGPATRFEIHHNADDFNKLFEPKPHVSIQSGASPAINAAATAQLSGGAFH